LATQLKDGDQQTYSGWVANGECTTGLSFYPLQFFAAEITNLIEITIISQFCLTVGIRCEYRHLLQS
jgi:hypothetical protein